MLVLVMLRQIIQKIRIGITVATLKLVVTKGSIVDGFCMISRSAKWHNVKGARKVVVSV